jgi:selenide,water dikinase
MITLNRAVAEVLERLPAGAVHACTDITGFGLLGHASEMATASHCTLEIDADRVPLLPGALALVTANVPGGGKTNRQHFVDRVLFTTPLGVERADLFLDPQTSGGLLVAIDPAHAEAVLPQLIAVAPAASRIGHVVPRTEHLIVIR